MTGVSRAYTDDEDDDAYFAYGAGIGGGHMSSGGTITINGGHVIGTCDGISAYAAGIGGGFEGKGGSVTITGGTVKGECISNDQAFGPGIGGGVDIDGSSGSSFGNITITGGNVTARSEGWNWCTAAGIGSGYCGVCGDITITGGTVEGNRIQKGKCVGQGIGAAEEGSAGKVTLSPEATVTNNRTRIYCIQCKAVEHGSVNANPYAVENETVSLDSRSETGYALKSLTVKDASGNSVAVAGDNTFVMPAASVTVSAVFDLEDYNITISSLNKCGSVTASVNGVGNAATAHMGETVTLTLVPGEDCVPVGLIVKQGDAQVELQQVSDTVYTFIMPMGEVTVTPRFHVIAFPLWVGQTRVTEANMDDIMGDGSLSLAFDDDAGSGTLTVNTSAPSVSGAHEETLLYVGCPLTIDAPEGLTLSDETAKYGIYSDGVDLTINGDVNLTAAGCAIHSGGSLRVAGDAEVHGGATNASLMEAGNGITVTGSISGDNASGGGLEAGKGVLTVEGDVHLEVGGGAMLRAWDGINVKGKLTGSNTKGLAGICMESSFGDIQVEGDIDVTVSGNGISAASNGVRLGNVVNLEVKGLYMVSGAKGVTIDGSVCGRNAFPSGLGISARQGGITIRGDVNIDDTGGTLLYAADGPIPVEGDVKGSTDKGNGVVAESGAVTLGSITDLQVGKNYLVMGTDDVTIWGGATGKNTDGAGIVSTGGSVSMRSGVWHITAGEGYPAIAAKDGFTFTGTQRIIAPVGGRIGGFEYGEITASGILAADGAPAGEVDIRSAYNVSFVRFDGTLLQRVEEVMDGETIVAPTESVRMGYVFAGWHLVTGSDPETLSDAAYDFDAPVTGDFVLKEVWNPEAYGEPDFTLPADLSEIGEDAFAGAAMRVVYIPDGCATIGAGAFRDCGSLRQIRVPAACAIGENAFEGCASLVIFGTPGSEAEHYCSAHDNCVFLAE